jgi:hypothetical protein
LAYISRFLYTESRRSQETVYFYRFAYICYMTSGGFNRVVALLCCIEGKLAIPSELKRSGNQRVSRYHLSIPMQSQRTRSTYSVSFWLGVGVLSMGPVTRVGAGSNPIWQGAALLPRNRRSVNKHAHQHITLSSTTEYPRRSLSRINYTMSYNPRMSMAPRTTSVNQRAPAPTEHDAFMTLVCAHFSLIRAHC